MPPAVRAITTTDDRAIVTFARPSRNAAAFAVMMGGPRSTQVQLARMDRRWRVIGEGDESPQQLISEADASPACIAAWNHEVRDALIELPSLARLRSQQIWASLSYGNPPCTMTIDTPSALVQYVEHTNGSWSQFPAGPYSFPPHPLSRSVWLDRAGFATLASHESPDGTAPAIGARVAPPSTGPRRTICHGCCHGDSCGRANSLQAG
jgi:hypothetical protein